MPAFTMAHKAAALYVCVYNRYNKIEMHIILINRQSQSRSGRQTIYDCFGHNFLSSGIAFHANQITEYNKKNTQKQKQKQKTKEIYVWMKWAKFICNFCTHI